MLVGRLHTALAEVAVDVCSPVLNWEVLGRRHEEMEKITHYTVAMMLLPTLLVQALHFSQ